MAGRSAQRSSKPRSILADVPGYGKARNSAQKAAERSPRPVVKHGNTYNLLRAYVLVHVNGRTIPAVNLAAARKWLVRNHHHGTVTQRGKELYRR